MTDLEQLESLLAARHSCIVVATDEEEYVRTLAAQAAVGQRKDLWAWSVTHGLHDGLVAGSTPLPDTTHAAAALYYLSNDREKRGIVMTLDLVPHLKDDRTLRALRDLIGKFTETGSTLLMVDHSHDLPPVVAASSTRLVISYPSEEEVEDLIKGTLRRCHEERRIEVSVGRSQLQTMVRNLHGLTRRQIRQIVRDCVSEDRRFDEQDIHHILALKRKTLHADGLLEYVEAPLDMGSIGGMDQLKGWLEQRRRALTEEAMKFGITPPRGVLMLGVQGAGKSLAAKAVATAWRRPLLRMDVGALYDRYIGESERRLRDALHQAELMAPIILWIDEIEKAFASAASHSADGGLSRRMFGHLLTWMQEREAPVFLIATANDIEALPPELLRKGRFDEIFFVDLPSPQARRQIFEIHLRKRERDPGDFDLDQLVSASGGFSGAEIEQAIVSALYDAFEGNGLLRTSDILAALRRSPPLSVTMAEKVQTLRAWAEGRCVPAE